MDTIPSWCADQFWRKVNKDTCLGDTCGCHRGLGHCWPWRGTISAATGYAHVSLRGYPGSTNKAHRIAWELTHGPIPAGMLVRHTCEVATCQNPDHMTLGTRAANALENKRKAQITKAQRTIEERFWVKVNKETCLGDICGCRRGLDCCWPWTGNILPDTGYGRFPDHRQKYNYALAHRIAWEITHGPIPEGLSICHRCDVRFCQNPTHFFLGTQRDNVQDAVSKDRHVKGVSHGEHKLTEADVHEILRLRGTMFQREIAARFQVSTQTIKRIFYGQAWVHITKQYAPPVQLPLEV